MKIGDLLYYRPVHHGDGCDEQVVGIIVDTCKGPSGELCFRTLWFDDYQFTEEPIQGGPRYSESVGVLSAAR